MTRRRAAPTQRREKKVASDLPPAPPPSAFLPPYPPSWVDRLQRWIDRLRGPYWLPYLTACLASLGLVWVLLTREGRTLSAGIVFADSVPFYGFWLLHYLDRRAAASLEEFRPTFTGSEAELRDARWRLTTLRAWPAAVVSLVALLLSVVVSVTWGLDSMSETVDRLLFFAADIFAGLYIYHSIRQLRLVNRLYATSTRVDLHNVAPLLTFSTLSAHTAIGGLLIVSAGVLITPEGFVGAFLPAAIFFALMAVLAFLLPLMGLHRRLVRAKDQEVADLNRRWQTCMSEVYRRLDQGDLSAADKVNTTLSTLERARAVIERIPTWPWRPETLRGLVAALVLPVVIWLVQYGLEKFLR